MNHFKRIAAFALGLGSGIAASYLSKPERRNKLRNQIFDFPSKEEKLENANPKNEASSKNDEIKTNKKERKNHEEMATA